MSVDDIVKLIEAIVKLLNVKVAREARIAADIVAEVVTPGVVRRTSKSNILWVDDRPSNNIYERQALEALGISFTLAKSTEEALEKISKQSFDAIISDMGRPPDSRAGYTCYIP